MVFTLARSDTLRIAHRSRRSFPDSGPGSSMPWMMKAYSRSPKWSSNSKSATNIAAYSRRICCRTSRNRLCSQQKVILSARQTSSGRDSPALTGHRSPLTFAIRGSLTFFRAETSFSCNHDANVRNIQVRRPTMEGLCTAISPLAGASSSYFRRQLAFLTRLISQSGSSVLCYL